MIDNKMPRLVRGILLSSLRCRCLQWMEDLPFERAFSQHEMGLGTGRTNEEF